MVWGQTKFVEQNNIVIDSPDQVIASICKRSADETTPRQQ
jgi:hypothetical protein